VSTWDLSRLEANNYEGFQIAWQSDETVFLRPPKESCENPFLLNSGRISFLVV
jgi:hypothetical protein